MAPDEALARVAASGRSPLTPAAVAAMQATAGNRAVTRMLVARHAGPDNLKDPHDASAHTDEKDQREHDKQAQESFDRLSTAGMEEELRKLATEGTGCYDIDRRPAAARAPGADPPDPADHHRRRDRDRQGGSRPPCAARPHEDRRALVARRRQGEDPGLEDQGRVTAVAVLQHVAQRGHRERPRHHAQAGEEGLHRREAAAARVHRGRLADRPPGRPADLRRAGRRVLPQRQALHRRHVLPDPRAEGDGGSSEGHAVGLRLPALPGVGEPGGGSGPDGSGGRGRGEAGHAQGIEDRVRRAVRGHEALHDRAVARTSALRRRPTARQSRRSRPPRRSARRTPRSRPGSRSTRRARRRRPPRRRRKRLRPRRPRSSRRSRGSG